jgi:hypothetical protein
MVALEDTVVDKPTLVAFPDHPEVDIRHTAQII